MISEGSSGNPVDFEHFYQGAKGLGTGLQQYPKVHGSGTESDPYELCENNASEWSVTGDIGTPVNEGTDVSKGSYSIKATKSGSGTFVMMWNENGTFESEFGSSYSFFNPEAADRIKLEIKPSNAAIKLDAIKIWSDSNNAGHDQVYYIRHTNDGNGWTLSAGAWNELELFFRDFDDPYYRFYAKYINQIELEFSGGVTSDTVLIDGLRAEHPDAGIKKYGASTYVSTYAMRMNTCYFKQEYSMNLNIVAGAGFYAYGGFHMDLNYQLEWGGEGYGAGEDLFPINIVFDFIETDSYNIRLISNYEDSLFNNVNITTFTWMQRHGMNGSTPGAFYCLASNKQHKFTNCKIISGDIYVDDTVEFKNCTLMGYRYPIWGPDAVLENVKVINLTSAYCWVDYGELRDVNFVDWFTGVARTIIYNRQYRQVTPRTLTIIDATHDASDPAYPGIQVRKYWITEEQRVVDQICKFGFTMNVKVKNAAGTLLENATVKLVDAYATTVFEVNTDVNGDIVEQDVIIEENNLDNPLPDTGTHVKYLYPWKKGATNFDTIYYPFILTINKAGYAQYKDDNFELWKPYNQEIVLQLTTAETVIYSAELYGTTIY
jgi:hypothetical protein